MAFGKGVHFWLGHRVARMARIALATLLQRVPHWEVDLASAQRPRSGPIRGYTALPISLSADS